MPSEVFGWPEASLYIYAPGSTSSAIMAFCADVSLRLTWEWKERRLFGGTGAAYQRRCAIVTNGQLTIGQMYHDMKLYSQAASCSALAIDLRFSSVAGNSAGFSMPSAYVESWDVQGAEGSVFQSKVQIAVPEASAYGTGI